MEKDLKNYIVVELKFIIILKKCEVLIYATFTKCWI